MGYYMIYYLIIPQLRDVTNETVSHQGTVFTSEGAQCFSPESTQKTDSFQLPASILTRLKLCENENLIIDLFIIKMMKNISYLYPFLSARLWLLLCRIYEILNLKIAVYLLCNRFITVSFSCRFNIVVMS